MSPNQVNDKNILQVFDNIRESHLFIYIYIYIVRIAKEKKTFSKGFTSNWTSEPFKITTIVNRDRLFIALKILTVKKSMEHFMKLKYKK